MTMRQRIAQGKLFTDECEGLPEERARGKRWMMALNATGPDSLEERARLLEEIFGRDTGSWVEPPLYFCYGRNIQMGKGCYINFNCNFVDDGPIIFGDNVLIGPGVTISAVGHPVCPELRDYMFVAPVRLGNGCWIGAGACIGPGVSIGENSVIGAGSVVVQDIPANVVAVGNPCRVSREIGEHDRKYYFKNREISLADLEEERKLR